MTTRDLKADEALLCACPDTGRDKFIRGSGPYAGHSDICTAARHAGVIDGAGGTLAVLGREVQRTYEPSEANGISAKRWGFYGSSFDVTLAQSTAAAQQPAAPLLACQSFSAEAAPYDCACPEGSNKGNSVWGSGPFTADSGICSAAVLRGVVDEAGGLLNVLRVRGLESYSAASRNGVITSKWGPFDTSIIFDFNGN